MMKWTPPVRKAERADREGDQAGGDDRRSSQMTGIEVVPGSSSGQVISGS